MKKLFFLITSLLPALVFAQTVSKNFSVKGKVGNLNAPAEAFLFYQVGANNVVDSSLIVNGSFSISGFVTTPALAYLVIDHKGKGSQKLEKTPDLITFLLDNSDVTVTTNRDSISTAKITGSVINDDNKYLIAQMKPINDEATILNNERNSAPQSKQNSPEFQREMNAKGKVLQDRQQAVFQKFAVMHPNSYLSLTVLNAMGRQEVDPYAIESLFNALTPALKESESGKMLKISIDNSKTTAVGAIAPDFLQPDVNGNPVRLSSFKGKYVFIDFWASWCGPCRVENPTVVKAYNKYKNKNFTILGVSLDRPEAKADWLSAIKQDKLDWTQVSDLKFWGNQAAVLYFVQSIPANFLLDPDGKIIAKNLRGIDLDDKLEALFGKM